MIELAYEILNFSSGWFSIFFFQYGVQDLKLFVLRFAIYHIFFLLFFNHATSWLSLSCWSDFEYFSCDVTVVIQWWDGIFTIQVIFHSKLEELPTRLIQYFKIILSFDNNWLENPIFVKILSTSSHLLFEVWISLENGIMQVAFLEAIAIWVKLSLINEVCFFVMNHIVVTYNLGTCLTFTNFKWSIPNWILLPSITYSYLSIQNKVHLIYHIELIVDNAIVLALQKSSWNEALGDEEN